MKQIGIYAGKNLLRIILLLFAVSILTFALVTASPIDPLQANVGQAALGSMSEEQKEKLRSYWGVEEPPVQRYLNWLNAFIKGDAGISLLYRQPVMKVIAVKLGNSLFLMGLAWIISGLVGFVLGVIAGVFQGRLSDKMIKGYSLVIASTPSFWLGIILFFIGMGINLHSDSVIRHLRKPGDTRHYLPQKGMYRYVTSGNYFGELVEWIGFAVLTCSPAAWVFVLWTFANLAPRANSIRNRYREEFGKDAVGKKKRMIPFIY